MSFQEEGTCTEVLRLPAVTSAMPFPPDRFLKTYFALGDTEPSSRQSLGMSSSNAHVFALVLFSLFF